MTDPRSRQELKRAVEQLEKEREREDDTPEFGRPDPLTTEEKEALEEMFAVDSEDMYGPSENDALAELHEKYS